MHTVTPNGQQPYPYQEKRQQALQWLGDRYLCARPVERQTPKQEAKP